MNQDGRFQQALDVCRQKKERGLKSVFSTELGTRPGSEIVVELLDKGILLPHNDINQRDSWLIGEIPTPPRRQIRAESS